GRRQIVFVLVAISLTLASGITSAIGVHLLTLLQAQGIAFATAVALGTIVGPSQVGARLLEMLVGARVHPVWTAIASAALATAGLALLFGDVYLAAVGLAVYGAGNGLTSIVRGTLPLALFGAEGYATLMGRLGRPLLIAFAAAPFLAAVVLDRYGTAATIGAMVGVTSVNLLIGVLLSLLVRADRKRGERTASSY
ncbi:MAG: MFS transporter, partial [Rhodospirillales bacterium]|nr:MFS transporter [Rhodospirillales bacterium]